MKPKSLTTADQVRELGLSIGDVIVGRETYGSSWSESELTLLFYGMYIAVFMERRRNPSNKEWRVIGESATWTLAHRDWIKHDHINQRTDWLNIESKLAIDDESPIAAALKAQIAELMPLAKFGAMVLKTYKKGYVSDEEIGNFALRSGCLTQPSEGYAPDIEATHPAPFTPITADDVTPAMYQEWSKIFIGDDMRFATPKNRDMIAAAVNAYMGAKK